MYAQTVHRPPQRVNTLCRVISEDTPGARLKGYIEARWGRSKGGMEKLATDAGLRGRQTLYEWFAGGEPSMHSLGQLATALGVRRVDLVAAMDGVTAPETQKAAPPDWAERLERLLLLVAAQVGVQLTDEEYERVVGPGAAEVMAEARRVLAGSPHAPTGGGSVDRSVVRPGSS